MKRRRRDDGPHVTVVDTSRFAGYEVVSTLWATKRWGHGRVRQIVLRWFCRRWGHDATEWTTDELGIDVRHCKDGCGWNQVRRLDLVGARRETSAPIRETSAHTVGEDLLGDE